MGNNVITWRYDTALYYLVYCILFVVLYLHGNKQSGKASHFCVKGNLIEVDAEILHNNKSLKLVNMIYH